MNDFHFISLDKGTNDTERSETQELIRLVARSCVEEGVEERVEVRLEEGAASLSMSSNTLEESKRVADTVAVGASHDDGRNEEGIGRDDFLQQDSNETDRVPEQDSQFGVLVTEFGQFS